MNSLITKCIISALWLVLIPLLLLIILAGQWIWYVRKKREYLRLAAKLPSPKPFKMFLGNWYKKDRTFPTPLLTGEEITHSTLELLKAAAEKPYSVYSLWVGPIGEILVQKPQDAKIVLTSSKAIERHPSVDFLNFALGEGLITISGKKWKISRRYMNKIFHHENLNKLIDVFNQVGHQLVKDLACHASGESFDVIEPLAKGTVTSSSSLLFGIENQRNMDDNDLKLGASFVSRAFFHAGERANYPWLWCDQAFYFIKKKKLKDLQDLWTQFTSHGTNDNEQEEFITVTKTYKNILQEHGNTFSEANMDGEMKTIIVTGTDTTAIGVSTCLMLLGTHPDIQKKLYNEIVGLLGSEDQDVTTQDINNLPYLDQVIKESLRISTIVIMLPRRLTEEIKLSECTIPKGGTVTVSIVGLHFDPEVYQDPYVFNPERFTPENVAKRHPYSYLPFSGGPRNCIGKQYALMSMKIMLTHILRAYKIFASENLHDLRYLYTITLTSKHGYKIRLERRTT